MILIFISIFLWVIYLLFLIWSRWAWNQTGKGESGNPSERKPFITIIIPARNEEKNIIACLQSALNQNYPGESYEIIVVDDHSTDNTCILVNSMNDPRIRLIRLQDMIKETKSAAFKKMAIAIAVEAAKGELIVTTDADCTAGRQWLSSIADGYHDTGADLLVMPVRIKSRFHLLSVFEILDFLSLQGMTASLVSQGKISMANGANLCYTKKLFSTLNGYEGIDHIASGDDMLLVEKARAAGASIYYLKKGEVIVETNPSPDLPSFIRQRIRWASKSAGYKDARIKWVLGMVYLVNLTLILLFVKSLTGCNCSINSLGGIGLAEIFWLLLAGKMLFEFNFLWPVAGFFGQRKCLWFFPLAQIPHMIYIVCSGFLGMFGTYEWKGRRVK